MPRATGSDTTPKARAPFRLSQLEKRWDCSRMSVWRQRQDPRFPRVFTIGSLPYIWDDELRLFEETLAAETAAS